MSQQTVVVGHFGSGKTEFSVNLALAMADAGLRTALADLDVVDPYFRSRECAEMFGIRGINLICSSPGGIDADLPSMPPEVLTLFDTPGLYSVLDIGGDASGARVLARYRRRLMANDARVLCVVNANRPLTDTAESAVSYVRQIEKASGLKITGLVNNTHLCNKTEVQDVLAGAEMIHEVSEITGIPVACHVVSEELLDELPEIDGFIFPVKIYLKKPWE